jgi:hypothetical protein
MNAEAERGSVRTNLGGYGPGAESNCARAMAEAESVLRELSSSRASGANRVHGRSNTADETPLAPSLTPQRPGAPNLAPLVSTIFSSTRAWISLCMMVG